MDRHDTFKQTSESQFQSINSGDNLNQALAERRGCDASKILNEMPSHGARLDAIRDYQRETKNDSQHFPRSMSTLTKMVMRSRHSQIKISMTLKEISRNR